MTATDWVRIDLELACAICGHLFSNGERRPPIPPARLGYRFPADWTEPAGHAAAAHGSFAPETTWCFTQQRLAGAELIGQCSEPWCYRLAIEHPDDREIEVVSEQLEKLEHALDTARTRAARAAAERTLAGGHWILPLVRHPRGRAA